VTPSLRDGLDRRYVLAWHGAIEVAFLARIFGGGARRWRGRVIDVLRLAVLADRLEGRPGSPGSAYALADVHSARRWRAGWPG
jgi:hypothetical protein